MTNYCYLDVILWCFNSLSLFCAQKISRGFFLLSLGKMESVSFFIKFCSCFSHIHSFEETKGRKGFILKEIIWNVHFNFFFFSADLFLWAFEHGKLFTGCLSRSTLHFVGALMRFFCIIFIIIPAEVGQLCRCCTSYCRFLPNLLL